MVINPMILFGVGGAFKKISNIFGARSCSFEDFYKNFPLKEDFLMFDDLRVSCFRDKFNDLARRLDESDFFWIDKRFLFDVENSLVWFPVDGGIDLGFDFERPYVDSGILRDDFDDELRCELFNILRSLNRFDALVENVDSGSDFYQKKNTLFF